jgi:putative nucleotidyltransferase with HDIG domain
VEIRDMFTQTVRALSAAVDAKDSYTAGHSENVQQIARAIGEKLRCSEAELEALEWGGLLHDIGKIGIPDAVLLKPGPLDDREYELMKAHTTIGHQILSGSGSRVLQLSAEIALTHHECWDGTGYPAGLAGDAIPASGRLTAIADVFDSLMHRRTYKEAWSLDAALAEIERGAGVHFDPAAVEAFQSLDPERLLAPVAAGDAVHRLSDGGRSGLR